MELVFHPGLNQQNFEPKDFFTRQSSSENLALAYFLADSI